MDLLLQAFQALGTAAVLVYVVKVERRLVTLEVTLAHHVRWEEKHPFARQSMTEGDEA